MKTDPVRIRTVADLLDPMISYWFLELEEAANLEKVKEEINFVLQGEPALMGSWSEIARQIWTLLNRPASMYLYEAGRFWSLSDFLAENEHICNSEMREYIKNKFPPDVTISSSSEEKKPDEFELDLEKLQQKLEEDLACQQAAHERELNQASFFRVVHLAAAKNTCNAEIKKLRLAKEAAQAFKRLVSFIRVGDFSGATILLKTLKDNKLFDINQRDKAGLGLLDYALITGQFLVAYLLVRDYGVLPKLNFRFLARKSHADLFKVKAYPVPSGAEMQLRIGFFGQVSRHSAISVPEEWRQTLSKYISRQLTKLGPDPAELEALREEFMRQTLGPEFELALSEGCSAQRNAPVSAARG